MYRILCDGGLLHDDMAEGYKVMNAAYTGELGKAGQLTFDVLPGNPMYGSLQKLKSKIELWRDGALLFYGRILEDSADFYKMRKITCEGALAYLCDSIQLPYAYTGTLDGFIAQLLTRHNACVEADKQMQPGTITVTDDYINRSSIDHRPTKEVLDDLVKSYGGYMSVRKTDSGLAFDWLADYPTTATQEVRFAQNLADLTASVTGAETYTVLIPVGAKLEDSEERVGIASVNDGKDYIEDAEAVAAFGRICKVVTWDDVTVPANLLTKARAELAKGKGLKETLTLTALDLSLAGQSVPAFRLGQYIKVVSEPHGLERTYLVTKQQLNLGQPGADRLTLGGTKLTYTQQAAADGASTSDRIGRVEGSVDNQQVAIRELSRQMVASIQAAVDSIMLSVSEAYYAKDSDELISLIESKLSVTANGIEAQLNSVKAELEGDIDGTNDRVSEVNNYLRYSMGADGVGVVELGVEGNPIVLRQRYNRIYFNANGLDVMYIEVDPDTYKSRIYITEAEILGAVIIGGLALQRSPSAGIAVVKAGDYNG